MTSTHRPTAGLAGLSVGRMTLALLSILATSPTTSASRHRDSPFSEDLFLPPGLVPPSHTEPVEPSDHVFRLRHIFHHGTYKHPELHRRKDVVHDASRIYLAAEDGHEEMDIPTLTARSRGGHIERLADRRPSVVDPMVAKARQNGYAAVLDASAWSLDEIPTPDITDKGTVLTMAYIASNAYVETDDKADWHDVGDPFDKSHDFGWEGDGLRGHIWADENNSTIVIGLKGTTAAVFDGDGTTTNDKENDNLFFSCCCAQQGQWTWHQVCDCATGTYACNNTCVSKALREEHRYYAAARELYSNVTEIFPHSTIWIAGHSLGGAVSALLGLTYGLSVVTFEAVPDALAAARLGLPIPPGSNPSLPQTRQNTGAYHFGHTADPVYIGTCNGATASCSFAGYAMESACHTGQECVYDVVADKGWRVGIGTHKIRSVISDVIQKYEKVPECAATPECRDCAQWKMYESNGTDTTTTSVPSTTTRTRTRTSTCQTPGWWGCLDTTATTTTTTTTTTSISTSTCKTPGWFGCKDQVATTVESTTTPITTTATTTCETPGRFWGCYDPTTTTTAAQPGTNPPQLITSPPTGIPEPTTTTPPTNKGKCLHRNWVGWCKEREGDDVDEEGFSPDEM